MSSGGGGIKETAAKYNKKEMEDRCPRNRLMGAIRGYGELRDGKNSRQCAAL